MIGIAGGCNQDLREDSLGVAARLAGNHGEIKFGLLACKPLSHMSAVMNKTVWRSPTGLVRCRYMYHDMHEWVCIVFVNYSHRRDLL